MAEKLEAMVVLGDRNSRIKDFFDLHHLATRFEIDRATVAEAVRRTLEQGSPPRAGARGHAAAGKSVVDRTCMSRLKTGCSDDPLRGPPQNWASCRPTRTDRAAQLNR